jgi:hypothetical protein
MAIYRMLQKSAFGPDDIERLATAYESALRVLELNDRDDPITETIARRIIEAAQTGLRDPDSLCATAIKDLKVPEGTNCRFLPLTSHEGRRSDCAHERSPPSIKL